MDDTTERYPSQLAAELQRIAQHGFLGAEDRYYCEEAARFLMYLGGNGGIVACRICRRTKQVEDLQAHYIDIHGWRPESDPTMARLFIDHGLHHCPDARRWGEGLREDP